MAKLIDFDGEYMRFAAQALRDKGDLKDEALEAALNDTMRQWLSTKADFIGGKTPDEYFEKMPSLELIELMADYCASNMNVPEPMYRQISVRNECAAALADMALDEKKDLRARGTALSLICDMDADQATRVCVELMIRDTQLTDMAADWLQDAGYEAAQELLDRYPDASDNAQEAILDVLCYYPGISKTAQLLKRRLLSDHDHRAQHAAMAARLGDPELIEPLKMLAQLSEISYYDYKEIFNAIDALGGDPGEERQFYGDPDYELMRDPDVGLPPDLSQK